MLAICMSPLTKCLFRSFAWFLNKVVCGFCYGVQEILTCFVFQSLIRLIICKYCLQPYRFLIPLLCILCAHTFSFNVKLPSSIFALLHVLLYPIQKIIAKPKVKCSHYYLLEGWLVNYTHLDLFTIRFMSGISIFPISLHTYHYVRVVYFNYGSNISWN